MKSFDEEWEHLEYGFCNIPAISPAFVIEYGFCNIRARSPAFVIIEGVEGAICEGVCFVTDLLDLIEHSSS